MPQIPVTSPLGYIGVTTLLLGFFLIIAGLGILEIKQVTVKRGAKTWGLGLILVVTGIVFLLPEILLAPTTASTSTTPTPSLSFDFRVYANQEWQDTGISVNAGDRIVIEHISGLWFTGDGVDGGGHDASGAPNQWTCSDPNCHEPLHDFPKYALIGKIGDQKNILKVGNYLDFFANNSGTLYLRPNYGDEDITIFNPEGSLVIRITIQQ